MSYVLVQDDQTVIRPEEAAEMVQAKGVKGACAYLGVSESHLRRFLKTSGYRTEKTTVWTREKPNPAVSVVLEPSAGRIPQDQPA